MTQPFPPPVRTGPRPTPDLAGCRPAWRAAVAAVVDVDAADGRRAGCTGPGRRVAPVEGAAGARPGRAGRRGRRYGRRGARLRGRVRRQRGGIGEGIGRGMVAGEEEFYSSMSEEDFGWVGTAGPGRRSAPPVAPGARTRSGAQRLRAELLRGRLPGLRRPATTSPRRCRTTRSTADPAVAGSRVYAVMSLHRPRLTTTLPHADATAPGVVEVVAPGALASAAPHHRFPRSPPMSQPPYPPQGGNESGGETTRPSSSRSRTCPPGSASTPRRSPAQGSPSTGRAGETRQIGPGDLAAAQASFGQPGGPAGPRARASRRTASSPASRPTGSSRVSPSTASNRAAPVRPAAAVRAAAPVRRSSPSTASSRSTGSSPSTASNPRTASSRPTGSRPASRRTASSSGHPRARAASRRRATRTP